MLDISPIGLIAFCLICSRSVGGGKGEISFQIPKVKVPSIVIYAVSEIVLLAELISIHTPVSPLRSFDAIFVIHIFSIFVVFTHIFQGVSIGGQKGAFDTIRLIPLITFSGVTTIHESGVFVTGGEGTLRLSYCWLPIAFSTLLLLLLKLLLLCWKTICCSSSVALSPLCGATAAQEALQCGAYWLHGASLTVTPTTVCPEWPHQNPWMWEPYLRPG